jgi:glucokinase
MAVSSETRDRSGMKREQLTEEFLKSAERNGRGRTLYGAIDLGGRKVRSYVADAQGQVLGEDSRESLADSQECQAVIDQMVRSLNASVEQLDKFRLSKRNLVAVGIASPGPVNVKRGIVSNAPQLPNWRDVELVEIMTRQLGALGYEVSVHLQNDANAEALGEYTFGSGDGRDPMVYVTIGTGIGGGIIIGGELYIGKSGAAGEIGHMVIGGDGPNCGCGGGRGHLESLASGTAIARMGKELVDSGKSPFLEQLARESGQVTAEMMSLAADSGDRACRRIFEKVGCYLGIALASLVNIFNPDAVIIGGAVAKASHLFVEEAEETMRSRAMALTGRQVQFALGDLGSDAAGKGMVAYLRELAQADDYARAG